MNRNKQDPEGVEPARDGSDKHYFPARLVTGHTCSPRCERCRQDASAKGNPEGVN
jgi:hypothetical protein